MRAGSASSDATRRSCCHARAGEGARRPRAVVQHGRRRRASTIISAWSGNTRFADARSRRRAASTDTTVTVTVTVGKRRASASTNVLDDASLKRTVDLADRAGEAVARGSGADAGARSADVSRPSTRSSSAPRISIPKRARPRCSRAIDAADGGRQAGRADLRRRVPRGQRPRDRGGDEQRPVRVSPHDRRRLLGDGADAGRHGQRLGARRRARLERDRRRRRSAASPRRRPSPAAIRRRSSPACTRRCSSRRRSNDLVPLLAGALNARNADEGRSPFSKPGGGTRIGEKVADERVTLYSDPADPALLGAAVRRRGPAARPHGVDREGRAEEPRVHRGSGRRSRASSRPGNARWPAGWRSTGGTKSTEELIAGCERGILVTHFFYIRSLDPRTVLQTGLTRDGTFLIENGKITRALKNFRWNESPLLMLNRLEDIGRPEPTAAGRTDAGAARQRLQLQLYVGRGLIGCSWRATRAGE